MVLHVRPLQTGFLTKILYQVCHFFGTIPQPYLNTPHQNTTMVKYACWMEKLIREKRIAIKKCRQRLGYLDGPYCAYLRSHWLVARGCWRHRLCVPAKLHAVLHVNGLNTFNLKNGVICRHTLHNELQPIKTHRLHVYCLQSPWHYPQGKIARLRNLASSLAGQHLKSNLRINYSSLLG